MNAIGIICVKKNSNRFPGKNLHEIDGEPMFYRNVRILQDCTYVDDVYVSTDSDTIKDYCSIRGVKNIHRGVNITHDEQPIFDVLKYTYMKIPDRYNIIITVLPNTINHTTGDIDNAMRKILADNCHEIRSFNKHGDETGIIAMQEHVLLKKPEISSYLGAIITDGREIHYREELNE